MPPEVIVGYTIERSLAPQETRAALEHIWAQHTARNVPATLFLLGRSIETNHEDLLRFAGTDLFDLAQHTYSHIGFKDIREDRGDGQIRHVPGASPECIRQEIERTNQLIARRFGRRCVGVEGARGYYLGLLDRPDLVSLLIDLGAHYCVTYCRNQAGWNPVDLDVQPFWYTTATGGRLLEIPNQGWQDAAFIKVHGAHAVTDYFRFCCGCLDTVVTRDLRVAFIMHDWVIQTWDARFDHMARFLDAVGDRDLTVRSCRQLHAAMLASCESAPRQPACPAETAGPREVATR